MLILVFAAAVFGYPAAATFVWRRGQQRALWVLMIVAVAGSGMAALLLASQWGGNRLAASYGYAAIAMGTVRLLGLEVALPMIVSTIILRFVLPKVSPQVAYGVGVVAMLVMSIGGIVAETFIV